MSPNTPPRCYWHAVQYLQSNGTEARYSDRAQWIVHRFHEWEATGKAGHIDWSDTAWRTHQRRQQEMAA